MKTLVSRFFFTIKQPMDVKVDEARKKQAAKSTRNDVITNGGGRAEYDDSRTVAPFSV